MTATVTLTAGTPITLGSGLRSSRARAALRHAIYAPIDDYRTPASDSDIATAWLAAGMVGLALIAALSL